jgi:hypothetical protein
MEQLQIVFANLVLPLKLLHLPVQEDKSNFLHFLVAVRATQAL